MMKKGEQRLNNKMGYIFGYFLFTTILYLVLILFEKVPESWTYIHIMGITLIISMIGVSFKRLLR